METLLLADIYKLFSDGMILGGIVSAFPFIISFAINGIIAIIRKNT